MKTGRCILPGGDWKAYGKVYEVSNLSSGAGSSLADLLNLSESKTVGNSSLRDRSGLSRFQKLQ